MAATSPDPAEDLALVRRALAGGAADVERLVERLRCVPRIIAQRNARWGEPFGASELEDLSQEVMIAVWRKLDTYEGRSPLEGWVYRFTHLEMLYRLRRLDRRPTLAADLGNEAVLDLAAPGAFPPEEAELLYRALDDLDADQAAVIRAKCLDGLTFPEIADRFSCSQNTAKTRYYRGLQRLRALLARTGAGDEASGEPSREQGATR